MEGIDVCECVWRRRVWVYVSELESVWMDVCVRVLMKTRERGGRRKKG